LNSHTAGSIFNIQQRSRSSGQAGFDFLLILELSDSFPPSTDVLIPGTKTIGLSTDILDLKAFAAAAGYVDSSVLLNISDPPFVCQEEWATPTYEVCFFFWSKICYLLNDRSSFLH
jgi:hypothetical protein